MPASAATASTSRTARRLKSTSTAVSVRPSTSSRLRSRRLVLLVSGRPVLLRRRRRCLPADRHAVCPPLPNAQRCQEGCELPRILRQGDLHLQRQLQYRRRRLLHRGLAEHRRRRHLWQRHREVHRHRAAERLGWYLSGEFGHYWLGTTDAFYGSVNFPAGTPLPDYSTWNVGLGFTYKVFTLDLPLLRHRPDRGRVQRADRRPHRHRNAGNITADQSGRLSVEMVRRDVHRQAVGRPDLAAASK